MKRNSRKGQGLAEYGMILVLVSLLAISFSDSIGQWVVGMYSGTTGVVEQVSQNVAPTESAPPPDPTPAP